MKPCNITVTKDQVNILTNLRRLLSFLNCGHADSKVDTFGISKAAAKEEPDAVWGTQFLWGQHTTATYLKTQIKYTAYVLRLHVL